MGRLFNSGNTLSLDGPKGKMKPTNIPNHIWQQVPEKDKQAYRDNPQASEQWYKQMLSSKSGYIPIDKREDKTADYWSKGEQYKRNLKELANIGLHTAKMPLQAGAVALQSQDKQKTGGQVNKWTIIQ